MTTVSSLPLHEIPSRLRSFPQHWPFPRGDLYHWIPVLDRFDEILEGLVKEYKLHDGPQTLPFGRKLLLGRSDGGAEAAASASRDDELDNLGFGPEGDRELAESVLQFSRLLMDSCGNRSLYSSSERLGELLNTTSLSLLSSTLHLAFRLAIRYHYSRARSAQPHALSPSLLSSHYNISLDRVQKLVEPFVKATIIASPEQSMVASSSNPKGKEKASSAQRARRKSLNNNDLMSFVKEDPSEALQEAYLEFGNVSFQYYHTSPSPESADESSPIAQTSGVSLPSQTPPRKASALSRSQRPGGGDSSTSVEAGDNNEPQNMPQQALQSNGYRSINISSSTLKKSTLEQLLAAHLGDLPKTAHYEFLHRLRVAKAMAESRSSRLQVVEVRILAITNLAYIYPENMYQQKVLQQDSDEPRRLQIVHQLADIVRPANKTRSSLPLELRTTAVGALEGLSKHKSRFGDVCAALQVNVNHGIIFHILQDAITDLGSESIDSDSLLHDDWREALFSLLDSLPTTGSSSRTAETLIGAGLFDILVRVLELKTEKAERVHSRILMFIMTITHGARDSLQTFANSKGFHVVADLVAYEVASSLEQVRAGKAIPGNFKSHVMDYEMPFFQQQTLRWLFKFINSMLTQSSGNADRLVRNLIDSPQLLTGLRDVIENAKIFGSNIWSGAINIMSSFIHNEPTSYAVILEAGLSKALLEAIAQKSIDTTASGSESTGRADEAIKVLKSDDGEKLFVYKQTSTDLESERGDEITLLRSKNAELAKGILPATDTIVQIPQVFGAMCLNNSGQELLLNSGVLDVFCEIFESAEHVKALSSDISTAKVLGNTFDELVRHHPRLKHTVIRAIVVTMARVSYLCRKRATEKFEGASLWSADADGKLVSNKSAIDSDDVEMSGSYSPGSSKTRQSIAVTDYLSVLTSFLVGFCENHASCSTLIQAGGVEFVLDVATLPSLPHDFNNRHESHDLARIVHTLMEHKPHLVLPAVLVRTTASLSKLDKFTSFESQTTFFSRYLDSTVREDGSQDYSLSNGREVVKALVEVHTLCTILTQCFTQPVMSTTRSQHTLFSQVNLADYYCLLVKGLGKLHRVCLWEEILLQRRLPDSLKHSTRIDAHGFGTEEADRVLGLIGNDSTDTSGNGPSLRRQSQASVSGASSRSSLNSVETELMLKNAPVLRYLLSQIPLTITPFLQGLGRSLVPKRRLDPYLRQNGYKVADSIAEAAIGELQYSALGAASARDRFAYLIVVLTSTSQLVAGGPADRHGSMCLTLILQSFKRQGGLRIVNELLEMFLNEVSRKSEEQDRALVSCALGAMKIILSFYGQLTTPKTIIESAQSQAVQTSERDRDRDSAYYFSPSQFLVDLRVLVLASVKPIWDSAIAEKSSVAVVKCLIDILRSIMEADHETGALQRSDPVPVRKKPDVKTYATSSDRRAALQARGVPAELASESLYRCFNNREAAEEYCDAHLCKLSIPRVPIPSYEQFERESKAPSPSPTPQRLPSAETIPDAEEESAHEESSVTSDDPEPANIEAFAMHNPQNETRVDNSAVAGPVTPAVESSRAGTQDVDDENGMAMSIDNLLNLSEQATQPQSTADQENTDHNRELSAPQPPKSSEIQAHDMSTIDELNDLRSGVRESLIDHVLDMLSTHEGIAFDLADLITTAASKAPDAPTMRREVCETLVPSLISFQKDEDFRPNGHKVASYASLLAIILQQKEFYDAAYEEIEKNFTDLVKFVHIFSEPENSEPPSSPWVAQVLLVLEKLLAEDVQPQQIHWTPSTADTVVNTKDWKDPIAEIEHPTISLEDKAKLFEAVISILPRIGKDESLALSVVRILVILSRERVLADRLGDKHNLQRLFVVVKQLAGVSDERFQKTFLLVLRHIMEDEDIIRDAIRSEIINFFKPARRSQHDTTAYVRHMAHLIIRSPSLFLEVTNEKVRLERYEPGQKPQILSLKKEQQESESSHAQTKTTLEETPATVQPSTEEAQAAEEKSQLVETKVPIVERPDGVTHYLLSQLLSYKDVEDKVSEDITQDVPKNDKNAESNDLNSTSSPNLSLMTSGDATKRDADKKEDYQAEQHPIYNYRCFLLQCLTELLMSYPAAKIEFINFSAKADPKPGTPSKPRSGALNYLLTRLIPCGTLDRPESVVPKKRAGQSNWAMCAIVGLCLKPNPKPSATKDEEGAEESDSDLLFVRKFVLENALKAFKDASVVDEPLDAKYGRLLSLADLFIRLLVGRVVPNIQAYNSEVNSVIQKGIAKIMFERNYISTLTNAIADVDLNFPNSRRVIKYILRPLKTLTDTAIELSQNSDISSMPGQTDEDDISTASSVSEMDVEREETPDLFRNSTLGILEPGRDEQPSEESSEVDEDMYDEEYGDEMDYEEEIERDGDEVVSDEDEELDDAGPVEGLPGDTAMDVEVIIDGEDDQSEDEDDSEDSEDEDDEDMEDEGDVEIIDDDINGDDENDSLADDAEDGWQDDDGGDNFSDDEPGEGLEHVAADQGDEQEAAEGVGHGHALRGPMGDLVLDLQNDIGHGVGVPPPGVFEMDMDMGDARYNAEGDEEEDDDEDAEDEDVAFEADYDDDEGDVPPWGWDADDEPDLTATRHHHHHHHGGTRRIPSPWTIFPPGVDRGVIVPTYRSHNRLGADRSGDEGTNPLLQRSPSSTPRHGPSRNPWDPTAPFSDWIQMFHTRPRSGGPISIINSMMAAIGGGGPLEAGVPQALQIQIGGGSGTVLPLPGELQRLLSTRRAEIGVPRPSRDDSSLVPLFYPTRTIRRWQEEAQMLFGANNYLEKTQKVVGALLKMLVPPALEDEKKRKEQEVREEAEKKQKAAEEAKAEEERLANEKADKEAQEQRENEEREAAEREAAEITAAEHAVPTEEPTEEQTEEQDEPADEQPEAEAEAEANEAGSRDENAMEGLETVTATETAPNAPADPPSTTAEPVASAETERIRATFRGREVDITGLGIDLEYLNALPDELREEVLMQQLAEQRSQAAVAGEAPTEISPEFLNALPPDIRQEILQQEAADRRRREREEARRQAAANGNAPPAARAEEMDPASFLASLDPHLRSAVLLEQDDDMLNQLPADIQAEARALGGNDRMGRWAELPIPRLHRSNAQRRPAEEQPETSAKKHRRQVVQMLDKAGVATLLRLLFISQQGSAKDALNKILENVSQNRQNRAEVLSLLLSVLQEGSMDVNAIEKSFMHLSIRAKPSQTTQKNPQPLKRTSTGSFVAPLNSDMSPATIIQQCLSTLVYLTTHNMHVPSFFLAENDNASRGKSSKKGKGKDNRASKFALNSLLGLLDRPLILDSAGCMEQLSTLLQSITHPLMMLQRREKERAGEENAKEPPEGIDEASNGTRDMREERATERTPSVEAETAAPQELHEQATDAGQTVEPVADSSTKPQESSKTEEPKKDRNLVPPVVPEHNLRLVVGVLAARECSAKTFRDTVSTINNLSAIPLAQEVFGKELIMQAQELGNVISKELDELIPQIRCAESGSDIQAAPAMTKFAAPSADQAKLLRVLTALDYLFDPKRMAKADAEGDQARSSLAKEDILTTLYESSTFGPLWGKLSECLSSMKERNYMLNVATILLPLVEALMVVCKNTALQESAAQKTVREFSVTSPVPESGIENLFFRFTEEHRKILNDLVRHNPRLMSGTFSLLVKNPKVLEFDNKRNYFTRRLHSRTEVRHAQPPLQLSVRREQVFVDSFKSLYFKSPEETKYGKLSIRFHGEEGVDAGGVTREWFQVMSRQMFNPDYVLFIPVASDRTTFHPNKLSHVNPDHLMFFKFIGRVIGKALYEGRALDCHFSRAVYKRILGRPVSIKDMETVDLDYYKSLLWMLENDISDIITETFSVETEAFGVTEVVDLIENGRNIPVTEENKQEYVQHVIEYRLTGSVKAQLEHFLGGKFTKFKSTANS